MAKAAVPSESSENFFQKFSDITPEAKRSKFSPFASYTDLSLCKMILRIPSVRSFSFIRLNKFGLLVN